MYSRRFPSAQGWGEQGTGTSLRVEPSDAGPGLTHEPCCEPERGIAEPRHHNQYPGEDSEIHFLARVDQSGSSAPFS